MQVLTVLLILVLSYLLGAIPFGWIIVKISSGKDVRRIGSGRMGGTNAMRAAGWLAGGLTALGDVLKGVATAWLVNWLMPTSDWVRVFAALIAVIGHNYSIFMIERTPEGRLHFRGGAGGATVLGGAIALWYPTWWFVLPLAALTFLFLGYASLTTISIAFFSLVIFSYRAFMGWGPWVYALYGLLAMGIVLWALRPNLKRLSNGTERMVGLRAYWMKKRGQLPPEPPQENKP